MVVELRKRQPKDKEAFKSQQDSEDESSNASCTFSSSPPVPVGTIRMAVGSMSTKTAQPNPKDANPLLSELSTAGVSVAETFSAWKRRQGKAQPQQNATSIALAEFIGLILSSSGCIVPVNHRNIDIESDDHSNMRDTLLHQIEYYGTSAFLADSPLVSKKKQFKYYIAECDSAVVEMQLQFVISSIILVSAVGYRPIRYAFTKVALSFLVIVNEYLNDDRKSNRLSDNARELVLAQIRNVYSGIFIKRIRDVAPEIRILCLFHLSKLGSNNLNLRDGPFQFIFWLIKDKNTEVRMASLKCLHDLVSTRGPLDEDLRLLIESQTMTIIDSALYEQDLKNNNYCRAHVLPQLALRNLIEQECYEKLASLIFAKNLDGKLCAVLVQYILNYEYKQFIVDAGIQISESSLFYSLCLFIRSTFTDMISKTMEKDAPPNTEEFRIACLYACFNIFHGSKFISEQEVGSIRESIANIEFQSLMHIMDQMIRNIHSVYFNIVSDNNENNLEFDMTPSEQSIATLLTVGIVRAKFGIRHGADKLMLFEAESQPENVEHGDQNNIKDIDSFPQPEFQEFIKDCIQYLPEVLERATIKDLNTAKESLFPSESFYQLNIVGVLEICRIATCGIISVTGSGAVAIETAKVWLSFREMNSYEAVVNSICSLLLKGTDEVITRAAFHALFGESALKTKPNEILSLSPSSSLNTGRKILVNQLHSLSKSLCCELETYGNLSDVQPVLGMLEKSLFKLATLIERTSLGFKDVVIQELSSELILTLLNVFSSLTETISVDEIILKAFKFISSIILHRNLFHIATNVEIEGLLTLKAIKSISNIALRAHELILSARNEAMVRLKNGELIGEVVGELQLSLQNNPLIYIFAGNASAIESNGLLSIFSDNSFLLLSGPFSSEFENIMEDVMRPVNEFIEALIQVVYAPSFIEFEHVSSNNLDEPKIETKSSEEIIETAIAYAQSSQLHLPCHHSAISTMNMTSKNHITVARKSLMILIRNLWISLRFDSEKNYWIDGVSFIFSLIDTWPKSLDEISKHAVEEFFETLSHNVETLSNATSEILVKFVSKLLLTNISAVCEYDDILRPRYQFHNMTKTCRDIHQMIKTHLSTRASSILTNAVKILVEDYGYNYLEQHDLILDSSIVNLHFNLIFQTMTTLSSIGGASKFSLITPLDSHQLYVFIKRIFANQLVPDSVMEDSSKFLSHLKTIAKQGNLDVGDDNRNQKLIKSKSPLPEGTKRARKSPQSLDIDFQTEFQASPLTKRPKRV